jgi:hypothetical protein
MRRAGYVVRTRANRNACGRSILRSLKQRGLLEIVDMNGAEILKRVLKTEDGIDIAVRSCEPGN